MATKRTIARNVIWNWAGMAAEMAAGFVILPFLIHHLGWTRQGLWTIIASLTSYFGLLDLGLRGSVGRQIAFYRAQENQTKVNETLNTALAILSGAGLLALLGGAALQAVFFRCYDVPSDEVAATRWALALAFVNLAMILIMNVFDATLWAFQRFDVLNAIDIPSVLVRAGLTLYLVGRGGGLVTLASITLGVTAASVLAKASAAFILDRSLRLSPLHVNREARQQLFGYGIWLCLLSLGRMISSRFGPLLVGAILTVEQVTPFSIATRIVAYATALVAATTGVLTPVVTGLFAQQDLARLHRLFLKGSRYCTAFALMLALVFVFLGRPFINLWVGPNLAFTATLLMVLGLGEILPFSQAVSSGVTLATARHRILGWMSVLENVLAFGFALVLVRPFGLVGACFAFAVPACLLRGVVQLVYGCRLAEVPFWDFARQVALPALAALALPALALGSWVSWRSPATWPELLAVGGAFAACSSVACLLVLGDSPLIPRLRFGLVTLPLIPRLRFGLVLPSMIQARSASEGDPRLPSMIQARSASEGSGSEHKTLSTAAVEEVDGVESEARASEAVSA